MDEKKKTKMLNHKIECEFCEITESRRKEPSLLINVVEKNLYFLIVCVHKYKNYELDIVWMKRHNAPLHFSV